MRQFSSDNPCGSFLAISDIAYRRLHRCRHIRTRIAIRHGEDIKRVNLFTMFFQPCSSSQDGLLEILTIKDTDAPGPLSYSTRWIFLHSRFATFSPSLCNRWLHYFLSGDPGPCNNPWTLIFTWATGIPNIFSVENLTLLIIL